MIYYGGSVRDAPGKELSHRQANIGCGKRATAGGSRCEKTREGFKGNGGRSGDGNRRCMFAYIVWERFEKAFIHLSRPLEVALLDGVRDKFQPGLSIKGILFDSLTQPGKPREGLWLPCQQLISRL